MLGRVGQEVEGGLEMEGAEREEVEGLEREEEEREVLGRVGQEVEGG